MQTPNAAVLSYSNAYCAFSFLRDQKKPDFSHFGLQEHTYKEIRKYINIDFSAELPVIQKDVEMYAT